MNQFNMNTPKEKIVCTEGYPTSWYTPTPLPYNTPFMTPFPAYEVDVEAFTDQQTAQWPSLQTFHGLAIQPTSPTHIIERPRSSPSTFGPSLNDVHWPENPLGIHFPMAEPQQVFSSSGTASTVAGSSVYQTPAQVFTTPSPPQQRRSSADTGRVYPHIAPNPAGHSNKRRQEEEADAPVSRSNSGKRQRTLSLECLNDEERLLASIKQEGYPWKEIADRFNDQTAQSIPVPTLQMRMNRLEAKLRIWEPEDIVALRKAVADYENKKWEVISERMLKHGIKKAWPAKYCSRKASELFSQEQQPQMQQQQQQQLQLQPQKLQPRMGHTPPQQQVTPRSLQHTPTPNFATLAGNMAYGYPVSY